MSVRRQDVTALSRRTYERLRRRELLARLDFGARLGLVLLPLGALANLIFLEDRLVERAAGFGAMFLWLVAALGVRRTSWVTRNAPAFVVLYMTGIMLGLLYLVSNSPRDLPILVAPVSSVVVAAPLLFPWGVRSQVWLAGLATVGFAALLWTTVPPGSTAAAFNLGMALVIMAVLSVLVTLLVERHRFAAHAERRRVRTLALQRRRLMEIGRELRSTLDVEALQPRLLGHARHVLPASWVTMTMRDSHGGYRITAAAGEPGIEELVGIQWGEAYRDRILNLFPPRELHIMPGSPIDEETIVPLRRVGVRHLLMASVGPPRQPLAFLTWGRSEDLGFTYAERRTALEMADQAHTALSAALLYGQALEASRLKSEFVSTISHEFRTPLSVIVGYAEMARDPELPIEDRVQALAGIETSARELLLVVEQTLDIGRIEAGRAPVQMERIRLPAFWQAMHEMCRLLPHKPEVELIWSLNPPELLICSDRRRLGIVIRNLVGNALKFTERGRVEARLALESDHLIVTVADTGIGIRPEDRDTIFEMFRQGDGSETRRHDGTGLGLYIVSQFVRQLDGEVEVSSRPGEGSCFTLRLPCRGVERLAEPPTSHRMAVVPLAAATGA